MRHAITAFLVSASLLAGCAASSQSSRSQYTAVPAKKDPHTFKPIDFEYDSKLPEATNFSRQLDIPIFQCSLEAETGSYAVRYGDRQGIAEYTQSLLDCIKHARGESDAAVSRLKAAKVPRKQSDLAKDLYAKWSAYLLTMSPYSRPDLKAKADYLAAKQALITEVKFSE
ncbi:hypothetical protein [Pseudomonas citronellolis]|uniref:hypothetical protein n=1 Tax=Pseudomonas citronellolis TaxID=53408 RepID=UPI00078E6DDD|nr:hypothetical protein [Pseudomonas citronellolis]AMO78056.1 hypothetical protein PcP3B5_46640 [Pseudomonas citronellolis]